MAIIFPPNDFLHTKSKPWTPNCLLSIATFFFPNLLLQWADGHRSSQSHGHCLSWSQISLDLSSLFIFFFSIFVNHKPKLWTPNPLSAAQLSSSQISHPIEPKVTIYVEAIAVVHLEAIYPSISLLLSSCSSQPLLIPLSRLIFFLFFSNLGRS